jgi:hypothetical protein
LPAVAIIEKNDQDESKRICLSIKDKNLNLKGGEIDRSNEKINFVRRLLTTKPVTAIHTYLNKYDSTTHASALLLKKETEKKEKKRRRNQTHTHKLKNISVIYFLQFYVAC